LPLHFICQSGSEALAVPGGALIVFGKIIGHLRDTGSDGYPANGEWSGLILDE
jgi:hypothetical protein